MNREISQSAHISQAPINILSNYRQDQQHWYALPSCITTSQHCTSSALATILGAQIRMCCLACQELEDRNKFLAALADKYTVSGLAEPGPLPELAPLPEEEAIILIQANERGRQARERAQTMRTFKRQRQLEDRRARSGVVRPSCLNQLQENTSILLLRLQQDRKACDHKAVRCTTRQPTLGRCDCKQCDEFVVFPASWQKNNGHVPEFAKLRGVVAYPC